MKEEQDDVPAWEAEDCRECGCKLEEFDSCDWKDGTWVCPECGMPQ